MHAVQEGQGGLLGAQGRGGLGLLRTQWTDLHHFLGATLDEEKRIR